MINKKTQFLLVFFKHKTIQLVCFVLSYFLVIGSLHAAFEPVTIVSASSVSLEGPAHHGIEIITSGNTNPNQTFYEVNIKVDTGFLPGWQVYNPELQPYKDGIRINIPYRNGILALKKDETYCVRVRAVYGATVTNWSEQCNITLTVGNIEAGDNDGDGLSNAQEYEHGTDPNNSDSDGDGIDDLTELQNGGDPNEATLPHVIVRTPTIDFGEGSPFGVRANQHQYIELENTGNDVAHFNGLEINHLPVEGATTPTEAFYVGQLPALLSHIPPQNLVRIPVSFIPKIKGLHQAEVTINVINQNNLDKIILTGTGIDIPGCQVSPTTINFGEVLVSDQLVKKEEVTIKNTKITGMDDSIEADGVFGFTMISDVEEIAPGLSYFKLLPGREIKIPILFRHKKPGNYQGHIKINSIHCGEQIINVTGVAQ